ncbi:alpha/beta fold hydrolase [Undibacterium sp. CY21W]|uniref:alpha/beta fold hydrolase n=1 Tax=Undibacterium sp. CY21W TaxID=2762293 RepID=UPI00164AE836|nr:alpha/beta hydrolase [Undibacterium sp. CY21W]MBC3926899.1 alpha/beta hydrolase [Undibacterium sp. CY21W]
MKTSTKTPRPHPWFNALAVALSFTLMLANVPTLAAADEARIKNIVLVHGAFTDGSSWTPVISRLQTMGYHVTAVQNHLTSLADDVAQTEKVLRRQAGKVLLVGHSWGGAVISQAGNASNVAGLVYLSALTPDSGESVAELLQRLDVKMTGLVPDEAGLIWLDQPEQFKKVMAGDIPLTRVRQLAAVQQPIAAHSFAEPVTQAAWHTKPSWYLLTSLDQALPPAAQQTMAQQIGASVRSIPASHLSMISRPLAVAAWIDQAAKAVVHTAAH